ncbi:MAG TPA: helix-turn-helix domain-containing protein [Solirubrobacteraceae bacterium]|jgi:DNA-binding transcriptional ArsR family regulator
MAPPPKNRNETDPVIAALAHGLRSEILRHCGAAASSPKDIAERIQEPIGNVSYHTRVLAEAGLLKQDRLEPRRGAVAHYYVVPPSAKKAIKNAADELAALAAAV